MLTKSFRVTGFVQAYLQPYLMPSPFDQETPEEYFDFVFTVDADEVEGGDEAFVRTFAQARLDERYPKNEVRKGWSRHLEFQVEAIKTVLVALLETKYEGDEVAGIFDDTEEGLESARKGEKALKDRTFDNYTIYRVPFGTPFAEIQQGWEKV